MKSYLSLIPISARVHRRQSRMTRICIILAVFLVTSIFSLLEMWTDGEVTAMRHNHGDWHIMLQNMSEEKAEQIMNDSGVAYSSWYDAINAEEGDTDSRFSIDGRNVAIYGVEETYSERIMNYPTEGAYPQNDKEVALSADAKELFNVQTGDNIILNTPAGDFSYTISGFYEDDEEFNDIIDGACVYLCRAAFDKVRSGNDIEPSPQFYIRFQKEHGLKKRIAAMKEEYSLTAENVRENTAVLSLLGASSNKSVNKLYPLAIICFGIILVAGIFMIASCMNSNVAQRTKFFGMMRCIGASKQQIVRFVRLEALNWCKTAIPIGCASGTVTCWILCLVLKFVVKGEWVDMPLFYISIRGILCGAAIGVITVFIAAQSPAKQAAKVSPVAAISGNTETAPKVVHAANTRFFKVETSLGIQHATRGKKNLLLMTGSFALTITLFLVFSGCLDLVHKLLPSVGSFTPDISIVSQDDTNSIDRSVVEQIAQVPGVKEVMGNMSHITCPAKINGVEGTVDLYSYGNAALDSSGKSVASGDLAKVYGDSGYVFTIYSNVTRLDVGDTVTIGEEELEVACVLSEGIGSVSSSPVIVCSEETYTRLTGERNYTLVSVVLEKDISEDDVNKIFDLAAGNVINDNREEKNVVSGSYWVVRLAVYGFLAIIALITVMNIMNSISMGVSARMKQYGAVRAVGMESRQITRMIAAEAVTYAVSGATVGVAFGLLLHYLLYEKVIITHFGGNWKFPVTAVAIILFMVLVSCALAVYAPAKRIRNMAITETINEL